MKTASNKHPIILSIGLIGIAAMILLLTSSCATRRASVARMDLEEGRDQPISPLVARTRALDELKGTVQEQIASAETRRLAEESRVRSTPPYFYKRFELYPAGVSEPEFSIKETGSTVRPYEATVTVQKARFTTKFHTSWSACDRDEQFIRDIGKQTDNYVHESGKWNLIYSLFEVERTSVLRGETWVDVTGKVERKAEQEGESVFARIGGFFRRIF